MKAVVLLNMGAPNNLDEVEIFLHNMFNDKYIIQAPLPIRKLIAKKIVKNRLPEAKKTYEMLNGKSPLVDLTKNLVSKLQLILGVDVYYAMRYTPPFVRDICDALKKYDEIIAVSMYPHYSTTTTKSSFEDFGKCIKKFKKIETYFDDEEYAKILANNIIKTLNGEKSEEFELIFSAHGLPQKIVDKGDLYQKHIIKNKEMILQQLSKKGVKFGDTHLAYQSRVGKMEWLKPYLEDKLAIIKSKKIIIYPISFTIDNSETMYELDIEYREMVKDKFLDYRVVKCPNDSDEFVKFLANKVKECL